MTHPDVIRELARVREQEIVRGARLAQPAQDLRALQRRPGTRRWLIARLRWWVTPEGACLKPGATLPPILQAAIRREAR